MSLGAQVRFNQGFCFPRVSGDEPALTGMVPDSTGFSPRERG